MPRLCLLLSIQVFEHMKNYKMLMSKLSSWLRPTADPSSEEALLFVQIFCHKNMPYHFAGNDSWIAQNFFSGKQMQKKLSSCTGCLWVDLMYRRDSGDAFARPFGTLQLM